MSRETGRTGRGFTLKSQAALAKQPWKKVFVGINQQNGVQIKNTPGQYGGMNILAIAGQLDLTVFDANSDFADPQTGAIITRVSVDASTNTEGGTLELGSPAPGDAGVEAEYGIYIFADNGNPSLTIHYK